MKDVRRKSNKRENTAIYQRIIVRIISSLFIYVPESGILIYSREKNFLLKNQLFWNDFFLWKFTQKQSMESYKKYL